MFRTLPWMTLFLALGLATNARALPLISEVFYDAAGSDNGAVFVELYGIAGTNLDGFVIEGVNGAGGGFGPSILLSGAIPADGFFVLGDDRGDGITDVAEADLVANFDFQNGPDSIVLRGSDGSVVDAVGYGVFDPGEVFAGEGTAALDAAAGSSLARVFANVDSDDNGIDFHVTPLPTPGFGALSPIPEPASSALMSVGLLGLAFMGRRN